MLRNEVSAVLIIFASVKFLSAMESEGQRGVQNSEEHVSTSYYYYFIQRR